MNFLMATQGLDAYQLPREEAGQEALRARVYDDEVRRWVAEVGVENVGRKLVKHVRLEEEQENVKCVQLADKYLSEAALGDANEDAMSTGSFYGKAAQQVGVPVPKGCTDPKASNFDPTARSDNDRQCPTPSASGMAEAS